MNVSPDRIRIARMRVGGEDLDVGGARRIGVDLHVEVGIALLEPVAFFMTRVSMSGPISQAPGISLNLTTGISCSPPIHTWRSTCPPGDPGQVDLPQVAIRCVTLTEDKEPHRLAACVADRLIVLGTGAHRRNPASWRRSPSCAATSGIASDSDSLKPRTHATAAELQHLRNPQVGVARSWMPDPEPRPAKASARIGCQDARHLGPWWHQASSGTPDRGVDRPVLASSRMPHETDRVGLGHLAVIGAESGWGAW
jgi:hypothetical protein